MKEAVFILDNFCRLYPDWHETQTPSRFQIYVVVLLAALVLLAFAPVCYAQMLSMKLLTPTTGWVSNDGHLYWTTDSGSHWTDITPIPPSPSRSVGQLSVFFLNTHQGWATLYLPAKPLSLAPQPHRLQNTLYDVAHTMNAGKTWSFSAFTYPTLSYVKEDAIAGLGGLFFIDPLHGWMSVALTGNSQPGDFVATQDGGKTWREANAVGYSGVVHFTSLKDGWFLGGPYSQLFATHDGGKTWQELHIAPPPEVGAATVPTYEGLPVFEDSRQGFTAVYYVGGPNVQPKFVVYATHDGGRTWSPVKMVGEAEEGSAGVLVPFAITDSVLIISKGKSADRLNLARIHLSGSLVSPIKFSAIAPPQMNFLNPGIGLAYRGDGRLLYTSDAGATWKDVTPWQIFKPTPGRPGAHLIKPHTPSTTVTLSSEAGSNHQGEWHHFGKNRATPEAVPAGADPSQAAGAGRMANLAKQMLVLVNRDRRDPANAAETHGQARPLKWNDKLAAVALAHSRDMLRRRYFAHVDREGRTPKDRINAAGIEWRALAENISLNQTVAEAEKDLMDEPRFQQNHRGNILNPEYTEVGIGIVQAPNGDLYITQDFVALLPRSGN